MAVDPAAKIFLGPCCSQGTQKFEFDKLNYGIEISNRQGILAYVEHDGLSVQYHKSPKELAEWFQNKGKKVSPAPLRAVKTNTP